MSKSGSPGYRVTINFKNNTNWPLTLTGHQAQTGGEWETYPPQVIDEGKTESLSESLKDIMDDAEGYVEYSLCDGENILEIKLIWLSPYPQNNREALYKWEISGDEYGSYKIENTTDDKTHSIVTYTISKKNRL